MTNNSKKETNKPSTRRLLLTSYSGLGRERITWESLPDGALGVSVGSEFLYQTDQDRFTSEAKRFYLSSEEVVSLVHELAIMNDETEEKNPYAKYSTDPIEARRGAVEAIVLAKHPEFAAIFRDEDPTLTGIGHPMSAADYHPIRQYDQVAQDGVLSELNHANRLLLAKEGEEEENAKLRRHRWILLIINVATAAYVIGGLV